MKSLKKQIQTTPESTGWQVIDKNIRGEAWIKVYEDFVRPLWTRKFTVLVQDEIAEEKNIGRLYE